MSPTQWEVMSDWSKRFVLRLSGVPRPSSLVFDEVIVIQRNGIEDKGDGKWKRPETRWSELCKTFAMKSIKCSVIAHSLLLHMHKEVRMRFNDARSILQETDVIYSATLCMKNKTCTDSEVDHSIIKHMSRMISTTLQLVTLRRTHAQRSSHCFDFVYNFAKYLL